MINIEISCCYIKFEFTCNTPLIDKNTFVTQNNFKKKHNIIAYIFSFYFNMYIDILIFQMKIVCIKY